MTHRILNYFRSCEAYNLTLITAVKLLQQSYGEIDQPWWFGDYLWMRGVWVGRDGVGKGGFRWGLFGWSQMTHGWIVLAWSLYGGYEWGQQVRLGGWKASSLYHYFNLQPNFKFCVSSYAAQMDGRLRAGCPKKIVNVGFPLILFQFLVYHVFLLWFTS